MFIFWLKPLSLGTDRSSNNSDFFTNIYTQTQEQTTEGIFNGRKTFYSYLQTREVLGLSDFKRCS